MRNVFISYRRDDAAGHAGRIAERLRARLGPSRVFFDEQSIHVGAAWEKEIAGRMKTTSLLVAVIGPRWFDSERQARLARPDDQVRQEIASAINTKTRILPVLVDGARMPDAAALPEEIRSLAGIQALPLPEAYFDQGIERILESVRPRRRALWISAIATALLLSTALAWMIVPRLAIGKSAYVVQVFQEQNGSAVPGVKVRVKSLVTDESDTRTTDAEGLTRFSMRNGSILAIGLEYLQNGRCVGARLPAFAAPKLPAITPVYLNSIPVRLRGECGEAGASNVAATPVRSDVPVAPPTAGRIAGDQGFLRYHLPWGTPAAPLVVSRAGYVVGFDPSIKLARWVGYKVNFHGSRRRLPEKYVPDPLVPVEAQLPMSAYSRNPYDRGNLVRRLDLSESEEATAFYLSVVAPQADRMNQTVWVRIEESATRASADADVWVLAGTAFLPAPGSNRVVTPKLDGNVPVPTHWFRIALRKRRDGPLDAVAFLVPNDFTVGSRPEQYLTSIEEIARRTGLDLLAELPASESRIKTARPSSLWTGE